MKNKECGGAPLLGAKMARGFDRTSHGSSLFLFVKIHHHCVTDCFRPYESLIRSEALIFLTLGTCTVQLCCQFIWYGKTLKNSLLTLLYNKLIGPDLSLLVMSDYPNLPPSFFPDLIPATTTVAWGTPLRCGPPPTLTPDFPE